MQESMVKFVLILIALLSLALGGVFLIIPGWFITASQAEAVNVAWLRNLGASLVSVQGFGLAIAAFRRRDTNPLLAIITIASTVEAGVIWYSLIVGEFSAEALWAVIVPGIVATTAAVLLWVAWISRRGSLKELLSGQPQLAHGGDAAAGPDMPTQSEMNAPGGVPPQEPPR
jgi:hypothetical protein